MSNVYTQEFIAAVKAVFPDWEAMHKALDSGSDIVGRYLDDNSYNDITLNDILEQDIVTLRQRVLRIQTIQELYSIFVSGHCYNSEVLCERYCPALYLQNNNDPNCLKPLVEKEICSDVGYVGFYPACKNWECRVKCWEKYRNMCNKE